MSRRSRRAGLAVATAAAVVAGATAVIASAYADTATYSFFSGTDTTPAKLDPDTAPVELGLRFTSSVDGTVDAVRFLKAPGDTGEHRVNVWAADGTNLATAVSASETDSGWQQVALPEPVEVSAGGTYVVSYHTTRYVATNDFFTEPVTAGPLTAGSPNGVYAYGPGGFPENSFRSTSYWVDLVFSTGEVTPPPSPSPTASPTPTPGGLNLPRIPWEGGPAYYAQFPSTTPWNDPTFFPVGVWFESVLSPDDVAKDKAAGLNTYVELTSNSDASLIRDAGMYAIPSGLPGKGSESVAGLLTDEADMIYGAGWDTWTGEEGWNTCQPIQDQGGKCGYTVMKHFSDATTSPRYANYGKGVMMWESDDEAQVFVNQFQELTSADMYFYTDNNLCPGEAERFLGIAPEFCRRSASYGLVLDRMRHLDGLDGQRKPIYGFVEDGHPFTEDDWPTITGDQIAGAVVNSLIHEARGIIYFNHNFGGPCQSQHVLRDACGAAVRPKVTETNQRIAALAPILNTQSYRYTFNPALDTMLKEYDGSYYVLAMPGPTGGTGSQALTLPTGIDVSTVEVMFEGRTLPVSGGRFTDTFAEEYSYHVYKITP